MNKFNSYRRGSASAHRFIAAVLAIFTILLLSFSAANAGPISAGKRSAPEKAPKALVSKDGDSCIDGGYPVTITLYDSTYNPTSTEDQDDKINHSAGNFIDKSGLDKDSSGDPIKFAVLMALYQKHVTDPNTGAFEKEYVGYAVRYITQEDLRDSGVETACLTFHKNTDGKTGEVINLSGYEIKDPDQAGDGDYVFEGPRLVHQTTDNHYEEADITWDSWYPDLSNTNVADTPPLGYKFADSKAYQESGFIKLYENNSTTIYSVQVILDADEAINIIGRDYLFVRVTIEHSSGSDNTYGFTDLSKYTPELSNGKLVYTVPVEKWYTRNKWQEDGPYTPTTEYGITGNEKKVTAELVALTHPQNSWENPKYVVIAEGQSVNQYTVVHYPVVEDGIPVTEVDGESVYAPDDIRQSIDIPAIQSRLVLDKIRLSKKVVQPIDYSLENLLTDHNLIAICDPDVAEKDYYQVAFENKQTMRPGSVYKTTHQMSGVLIRGELDGIDLAFADSGYLEKPSYVGLLPNPMPDQISQAGANTRKADDNPPDLYLGSGNCVYGTVVNGKDYFQDANADDAFNRHGMTYVSEELIDWNTLSDTVNSTYCRIFQSDNSG